MGKRRVLFASAAVVAAGIGVGGAVTANGRDARFHVKLTCASVRVLAAPVKSALLK